MRIIVDKVLIDCINKEFGLNLTYASFKKFYIEVVKLQRDLSPTVQKRRALNSDINDLLSGEHERFFEKQIIFEENRNEAEKPSKLK